MCVCVCKKKYIHICNFCIPKSSSYTKYIFAVEYCTLILNYTYKQKCEIHRTFALHQMAKQNTRIFMINGEVIKHVFIVRSVIYLTTANSPANVNTEVVRLLFCRLRFVVE